VSTGLKVYDICCGAGGFSAGFLAAGAETTGGMDIDPIAVMTAAANLPGSWVVGDLRNLPDLVMRDQEHPARQADIFVAGLPCQGFSAAGLRDPNHGLNFLYRDLLRTVAETQPRVVFFENVVGLVTKRNTATFGSIQDGFHRLGYDVAWRVLCAYDFGVPQTRRRLVVVATKGIRAEGVFEALHVAPRRVTVRDAFRGLRRRQANARLNHTFMAHGEDVVSMLRTLRPRGPISYRRLEWDKPAFTLISGHRALPVHPSEPRAISVREAARLQGFPDSFVFKSPASLQPSMVANAVPPPLAEALCRAYIRTRALASKPKTSPVKEAVTQTLASVGTELFIQDLSDHYLHKGRAFPWRRVKDPFRILLAELLLQQTDGAKVAEVWREASLKCQSAFQVSRLTPSALRPVFRQLGIMSRAKTLVEMARHLVHTHVGRVPVHFDELMRTPGVGLYMAAAVRVFAFGERDFPADTNAVRFFSRLTGRDINWKKSEVREIREALLPVVEAAPDPKAFVYGFLDFCAMVCKARNPECGVCPFRRKCRNDRGRRGQMEGNR